MLVSKKYLRRLCAKRLFALNNKEHVSVGDKISSFIVRLDHYDVMRPSMPHSDTRGRRIPKPRRPLSS